MPIFRFPLESLLAVRRNHRDVQRQRLAGIQHRDVELLGQCRALAADCARQRDVLRLLRAPGKIDVGACAAAERHLKDVVREIKQIEQQRTLLAAGIEERRQAALDADMAVTALERLSEKQRLAFETEESRREMLRLDEDWRNTHYPRALIDVP